MILSVLKCCQRAAKTFPKMNSGWRLFRICGTVVVAEILLAVYVEEFALPTPDMIYDLHMRFSREFSDFAHGNKYSAGALRYRHIGDRQRSTTE